MRNQSILGGVLVAAVLAFASIARAGISDLPPAGYKSIWVVPGVIHNATTGTAFICAAHQATTLGVEVFDAAGGAAVGSALGLALAAGETATVITQSLPGLTGGTNLFIGLPFQGSARILTIGGKVSCSAYVVSTMSNYAFSLPVVKAKGQKGQ